MKVSFKGVETSTKTRRLGPGVHDAVTIKSVAFGVSSKKQTPFCEVEFESKEGSLKDKFYTTVKALPKFKELFLNTGHSDNQLQREISEDEIRALLVGKTLRLKVVGREYVKTDQSGIAIASELGFSGFSEPMNVPFEKSKLSFDSDRDLTKLTSDETSEIVEMESESDSPF